MRVNKWFEKNILAYKYKNKMKERFSPNLDKALEWNINPEIQASLDNLKALWIDSELFQRFQNRVDAILEEHPEAVDIVCSEISKAWIWIEHATDEYNRKFRWVFDFWDDLDMAA